MLATEIAENQTETQLAVAHEVNHPAEHDRLGGNGPVEAG